MIAAFFQPVHSLGRDTAEQLHGDNQTNDNSYAVYMFHNITFS